MPIDKSLIGASSAPQTFEVTREAVERFIAAIEDISAQDEAPVQYAPPTFPTTFRMRVPGLNIDPSRMQVLHGEQEYNYTRRLRVGEKVTCTVRVVDIRERSGRGGTMTFVVTEMTGVDSEQRTVFTARSTGIVREK
jgi:hypothetical protein